jgi:hypothetical protein
MMIYWVIDGAGGWLGHRREAAHVITTNINPKTEYVERDSHEQTVICAL